MRRLLAFVEIVRRELIGQRKKLLLDCVIIILFVIPLISITQLTFRLPKILDQYAYELELTDTSVSKLDFEDLVELDRANVEMPQVHAMTSITLESESDADWVSGSLCYVDQHQKNYHIAVLQDYLLEGDMITADCNEQELIWISDTMQKRLLVQVGDTVTLFSEMGPVACKVAGVYQENIFASSFYMSLPLFEKMNEDSKCNAVTFRFQTLKAFRQTNRWLHEHYYETSTASEIINSIQLVESALFLTNVFLIILEISMLSSMMKAYYFSRRIHDTIMQTLGMSWVDCLLVNGMIFFVVTGVAMIIGTIAAPYLTQYLIGIVRELIGEIPFQVEVVNWKSVWIFVLLEMMVFVANVLNVKSIWPDHLCDLLHKRNE